MKTILKILMTSVIVFSLFSFNLNNSVLKETKWWKTTCKDGSVHYFQCECSNAQAQAVGSFQCKPVSQSIQ